MRVCASSSSFSSQSVRSGGAADGLTTSSGCGSNVSAMDVNSARRAMSAVRSRTSAWPRWTPSNVPTVTTEPRAANDSAIPHYHFRTPALAFADRDGQELVIVTEGDDVAPGDGRDRLAVRDAARLEIVERL